MYYYYPGKKFPAISVTGSKCEIMCPHCQGRYLQRMIQAETPDKLINVCKELDEKGALGCLISGGCDLSGRVPLPMRALMILKDETDLILNLHTGLVDQHTAEELHCVDPQYISFEVPTPYALKNLHQITATQENYFAALHFLEGLTVVPHVMVGLEKSEEIKAILQLKEMGFSSLVLIVFTPTRGTPLQNEVVSVKDILSTFEVARNSFSRLVMGCMRPRIKALEESAVLFDGVVLPSGWAKEEIASQRIPVEIKNTCCVVE